MTMVLCVSLSDLLQSYLEDVRSGIDEGPVKVWYVKSIDPLQILEFSILIKGNSWLASHAAISTSYFGLLYSKPWHFQNSILMVKNCKLTFLEGSSSRCCFSGY